MENQNSKVKPHDNSSQHQTQTQNINNLGNFYMKTKFSTSNSSFLFQSSKDNKSTPNIVLSSFQTSQNSKDEYGYKSQSKNPILSTKFAILTKNPLKHQKEHNVDKEVKNENSKQTKTLQKSMLQEIFAAEREDKSRKIDTKNYLK